MGTIGILGALDKEVALTIEELDDVSEQVIGGVTLTTGTYHSHRVVVAVAGMGTVNAAASTQLLITIGGADCIIFNGIAGNLNSELNLGDLVIARTTKYHDTDTSLIAESFPYLEEFECDPTLVAAGVKAVEELKLGGKVGIIATGNRFIQDPVIAKDIAARTGADCVAMEGAAIGQIAAKNNVPFVEIRSMSDNCNEEYESFSAKDFDLSSYAHIASKLVLKMVELLA